MDVTVSVDPLRVRLPARPGVPGSDYINASYIQVNIVLQILYTAVLLPAHYSWLN